MIRAFALLGFMFAFCAPCGAELSPNQLKEVALNPSPGAAVPLDAEFKSSPGEQLSLGDALGGKPAVLILVDFKCRFTCGTALAVAAAGLSGTGLEAGRDYNFLVMGIDPKDSLADAEAMKANYLAPFPALLAQAKFLNGERRLHRGCDKRSWLYAGLRSRTGRIRASARRGDPYRCWPRLPRHWRARP